MAPVMIQILSDLHLETQLSYDFVIRQTAPHLALLGEIGQVADDGLFVCLEKQLDRYWTVFFLFGNHEPLLGSFFGAKSRVREFADRMERLRARSTIGRFVFLDQTRYDVNDSLTILGCTLFSRVTTEQAPETVADHIDAHISDLQQLNAHVSETSAADPQRQIAIFTHHSPTLDDRAVEERHRNSPVSSGFATDLSAEECWANKAVAMWAFGHTHFSCDFSDGLGKRVAANQKGYGSASFEKSFHMRKVFVVGREAA
ncbi:hypothetical protein B0T24DRAFT_678434 [Lasiosphaeria ovina]|uniref:Calcineurin-like phosphoesterase domain-containing protein n=1 Tax=Lasiosphaeria ovina TaxID=92902 RepID=A0AAE0N6U4_9PEZI|nr:hypothetical protein B0T24DRAFT_678434 [Lasiosphaeria ovina]